MTNLNAFRGDDLIITLKFLQGEANLDITDYTVFFTMKRDIEVADASADISKTITSHTSPTIGETEIKVEDTLMDDLEPGVYHFDIQYKEPAPNYYIKTVLKGTITVLEDVTRRIG